MKTLIENSIKPIYSGKGPKLKTIFDSTDKAAAKYFDVSNLAGNEAEFYFKYTEEEEIKDRYITLNLPARIDEDTAKSFIIDSINAELGE